MRGAPLLLVLTLAFSLPAGAEAKRVDLGFPGIEDRLPIVFPEDYDESRQWPAILYYHGTGGRPETRLIRQHTSEKGWFTVGMSYMQRGKFTFTPETLNAELTILRSVRQHLVTKYRVDPKRVYVAGFSKGGWLSGLFLQAEPSLAGAVILGAGHVHQVRENPPNFAHRTPVFLGIGRQDGNYPFSLRAVTFYRNLGATTTLDTWPGQGHQFPPDGSPALTQWLTLEGQPDSDHRPAAREWAKTRLAEIKSLPDPVARWTALRDMPAAPYFALLDEAAQAEVTNAQADLEKTAVVSIEAKALVAHRNILRQEIDAHSQENYERSATAYLQLSNTYPDTRQGGIARQDHERIKTLLKHFAEQEQLRKDDLEPFGPEPADDPFDPDKPKPERRIPRNPLVR